MVTIEGDFSPHPIKAGNNVAEGLKDLHGFLKGIPAQAQASPIEDIEFELYFNTASYVPDLGDLRVTYGRAHSKPGQVNLISALACSFQNEPLPIVLKRLRKTRFTRGVETRLEGISQGLNGMELEWKYPVRAVDRIDPSFWFSWNKRYKNKDTYRSSIYPAILDALIHETAVLAAPKWVDLFGGDGELVELYVRDPRANPFVEAHIIDRNPRLLGQAGRRILRLPDFGVYAHNTLDLTKTGDVFDGVPKPRIVTAVGGLCEAIVTLKESTRIAMQVYQGLEEGGAFILAGLAPVLMDSLLARTIGFKVEQMTLPQKAVKGEDPKQLYVLRK